MASKSSPKTYREQYMQFSCRDSKEALCFQCVFVNNQSFVPKCTLAQTGPSVNSDCSWNIPFGYLEHQILRVAERTLSHGSGQRTVEMAGTILAKCSNCGLRSECKEIIQHLATCIFLIIHFRRHVFLSSILIQPFVNSRRMLHPELCILHLF